MPLVAHSSLPAFRRLREEGYEVLSPYEARRQDIRELHIGLLNLMPDRALRATERQFLRLVGACNRIVQICIHPFTVAPEARGPRASAYIADHYEDFASLQRTGLDALIITGANPSEEDMTREAFWRPMLDVVDWARAHVPSVLCSCFASHALLGHLYGVRRRRRPEKLWGVFSHRVIAPGSALVRAVNTRFDAPRSHRFEITPTQVEAAGCQVLAAGEHGLHLATSPDGFRFVFFQGHPEYDTESLLKEYKREVQRFLDGERRSWPPYPESYFCDAATRRLDEHRREALTALETAGPVPELPEAEVLPLLENTWTDTGKAIFNNWLGMVYQASGGDPRRRP